MTQWLMKNSKMQLSPNWKADPARHVPRNHRPILLWSSIISLVLLDKFLWAPGLKFLDTTQLDVIKLS